MSAQTKSLAMSWLIANVGGLFFFYNFIQMTLFNPLAEALMGRLLLEPSAFSQISVSILLALALVARPVGI